MVYQSVLLIHFASIAAFLLAHSVSWFVAFRLTTEHNPENICRLLNLSRKSLRLMYIPFMAVFITGVILGFMGNWWGRLWIWAALGVGLVLSIAMSALGTLYYDRVRIAVGLPPFHPPRQKSPSATSTTPEELSMLLSTARLQVLASIGIIGLAVIMWLMTVKPF